MPSSLETSRLACYCLAATAAAAGSGGAAVADVTSGSFSVSFGRSAGTNFFNGFSANTTNIYGYGMLGMGDLRMGMFAFQATSYANAGAYMWVGAGYIGSGTAESYAIFNQSSIPFGDSSMMRGGGMVEAGVVWPVGSTAALSTTNRLTISVFYTYENASYTSQTSTFTNPHATGTKFVNFFVDGEGEADIYGWVQFDWDITDANNWSVSISNWAYSDDGPLAAGSTGAPAVPGLGGLAALAVGAAGVRGRRQRVVG